MDLARSPPGAGAHAAGTVGSALCLQGLALDEAGCLCARATLSGARLLDEALPTVRTARFRPGPGALRGAPQPKGAGRWAPWAW